MNYRCEKCGFVITEKPTKEALQKHFPELRGMEDFECPSYKQAPVLVPCKGKLIKEDK